MIKLLYSKYYPGALTTALAKAYNVEEVNVGGYITVLVNNIQVYRACIQDVNECSAKVARVVRATHEAIQINVLIKYCAMKTLLFDHLQAQYRKEHNSLSHKMAHLFKKETFYDQVIKILENVVVADDSDVVNMTDDIHFKIFDNGLDNTSISNFVAMYSFSNEIIDITSHNIKLISPNHPIRRDIFVIRLLTEFTRAVGKKLKSNCRDRVHTIMLREIKWRQGYTRDAIRETALRDLSAVIVRYIDFPQV